VIDGDKQQIKEDITIFVIVPTNLYLLWANSSQSNFFDWLHPDVLLIQFIELNTTGFRLAHQ
jgi:hypothetical protein